LRHAARTPCVLTWKRPPATSWSGWKLAEREIGVDGPIREHYLVSGFDTDEESRHVTEVCWPVFQTGPATHAP
jgi:hypothetical protein